MDFLDLAKKRYSSRSYLPQKVEEEKLMQILEAGRVAPTACNLQPHRFLVINTEEGLKKLSKGTNFHGAPLAVIVCGDSDKVWVRPFDGKNMVDIDTSIVTTHMMLKTEELGLGSCWLTYFNPEVIRSEFNIPANFVPVNILAIGYPAGKRPSPERHVEARKPMKEILFYESF